MATAQSGGGSAMHSGANYQDRVAAWIAVRILGERDASPLWELPAATTFEYVRCETAEPVDDVLVGTSAPGHIFMQAKHSLSLGATEGSEFASVVDQFVRQFHAHPNTHMPPAWDRPLDSSTDRLILVTSSSSSTPVRQTLPTVLNRIRSLTPDQSIEEATASNDDTTALTTFQSQLLRSWREVRGVPPSDQEVRAIVSLIRVQVLDVDPGEPQEREAKDLLRATILKNPAQADLAWSQIVQACAGYAAEHTGANRAELQRLLTASDIELQAARSYRADIEKLKSWSESTLNSLAPLSEIRIAQAQTVKIFRNSTVELRNAVLQGSLVLVGQPGAGKSGTLHDLSNDLKLDGDVLLFAVGQFEAGSLGSLRNEIGCSHEILEVLENWPGVKPGFLLIDALDAARTDTGARALRDLIASVFAGKNRWRVVASIRKFDLRYNRGLQVLFAGGPSSADYQDPEFKAVRHFNIPLLTDGELQQVQSQSSELGNVIMNAGSDLRQLLRNPFNLRLMAELVGNGVSVTSLTPIRTQIELIERYWHERVIGTDPQGDAREVILRQATTEMVKKRTLRIGREVVAKDSPGSNALRELLSVQLLVEWQPTPEALPDRYVITYSHHILFDYAVSRLLFRGPVERVLEHMAGEPDLILAVRPSLVYHFQYLWGLESNRQRFWECVFAFMVSTTIPSTGKTVGPVVASQMIAEISDCAGLLNAMKDEHNGHHVASREAFRHLIGAIKSSGSEVNRPIAGQGSPPWCELLERASRL